MNKGEHKTEPLAVHWFRRDLRLEDNRALARALDSGLPVLPVFIFDSQIIEELQADDARVSFIYKQLEHIQGQLAIHHSSLQVYMGKPADVWNELLALYEIRAVYANRDYEPYAIQRDNEVAALLAARGIPFHRYKDQVIFEENEIVKKDGKPYTVFTPYKRRWLEKYNAAEHLLAEEKGRGRFLSLSGDLPKPEALGFRPASIQVKPYDLSGLKSYGRLRDSPSADATSHLSPHLRFGTVSVRSILRRLEAGDEVFLSELIWREFFMQILFHFPMW